MPDDTQHPGRIAFPKLLTDMGLLGTGVEIGVFRGWHSKLLLDNWAGKKIWGVDCYRQIPFFLDGVDVNKFHYSPKMWASVKATGEATLAPYGDRFELIHKDSEKASERFDDGSLDWVYVDDGHFFEAVIRDIDFWERKIRPGGVIAGHDYYDEHTACTVEVKMAVDYHYGDRVKSWDTGKLPTWYVLL